MVAINVYASTDVHTEYIDNNNEEVINITNEEKMRVNYFEIRKKSRLYLQAKEIVDSCCTVGNENFFVINVKPSVKSYECLLAFIEYYCLDRFRVKYICVPCYNIGKIFIIKEKRNIEYNIVFEIPYGERNKYIDELYHINNLLKNGMFSILVNNNIYSLEALCYVETDDDILIERIQKFIATNKLSKKYSKGFTEFFEEIGERRWNMETFYQCSKEQFISDFRNLFFFPERESLKVNGYTDKQYFSPKVFISYCHDKSNLVNEFAKKLEAKNINFWLDTNDLQSGVPLVRSLLKAIEDSDITISFVSKSMENSNYAQAELDSIFSAFIKKESKWVFVKVDDVDVGTVFPRLSDYVYIDYNAHQDIEEIINDVIKKYSHERSKE